MLKITYLGDFKTHCLHEQSGQSFETDAPKDNQGKGERISPTDLVGAALGSCILTILGIYAKQRQIDIEKATAQVLKEMSKDAPRRIIRLQIHITIPANPPDDVKKYLEEKARLCPVFHSLHPELQKDVTFKWGNP